MKRRFWLYTLPILLLLAVTLPHLEQGDFRAETAHYGAIGLQCWQNPALFWTPHEHPAICYFNKPPLVLWIHGWVLHVFGISLATVRLPTILAAAGCILFTIGIVRRLSGPAFAMTTGCVMAVTYEFFRRSREICLDMWQLLFMLAAAWLWVISGNRDRRHLTWLAGIPLGLALMSKPFMALVLIPILTLWLYHERRGQTLQDRGYGAILAIALTAILIALPWHGSMIYLHGTAFMRQYFGHEVVQRLQGLRNEEPWWYYLVEIGRSYWPWMIALIATLARLGKGFIARQHRVVLQLAAAWLVIWAIVLMVFPDKRPRYALPLYPMMAMMAAYGLCTAPWPILRKWYRRGLPRTALLVVVFGLLIHFLPIRFQDPPEPDLTALVEWAKTRNPPLVYSAAMTAIDESTIFLKAGYWPTPLHLAPKPLKPGSLILYSDKFAWRPPKTTRPVFRQGPYHVVEWSPAPGNAPLAGADNAR